MENVKRIPYGVSDYRRVIQENMYYVDKTAYIQLLESTADFVFMIRPRRFGKSLFLSMMRYYYGVEYKDDFDRLFGQTWIGQHPTPTHNTYQVLELNFSMASAPLDKLEQRVNEHISLRVNFFLSRYKSYYDPQKVEMVMNETSAGKKLEALSGMAQELEIPLYLIIDEYDNFTNVVLSEHGEETYHQLTHASGFFRDYFKLFKGTFTRIYMTGVSPVTLDDLTSGFNIGWNASNDPELNAMLGFKESDVRQMMEYYQEAGRLNGDISQLLEEMKPWYDNYCFSKECVNNEKLFNTVMVLYFMQHLVINKRKPEEWVDKNVNTDYAKLRMLVDIDRDNMHSERQSFIEEVMTRGQVQFDLQTSFPAQHIMKNDNFKSLLYYFGMLTITGSGFGGVKMGIPNECVRQQYYSYIKDYYGTTDWVDFNVLSSEFVEFAQGNWQRYMEATARLFRSNTSVRSFIRGEATLQGFYYGIFGLMKAFIMRPELEMNKGYCDLFLIPNHILFPGEIHHSYLIELKYAKPTDTDERVRELAEEGRAQLRQYSDDQLAELTAHDVKLHRLLLVYRGWDNEVMEEVDK